METIEAIYERGKLKLVGNPKLEGSVFKVRIVNRDAILTEADMRDILKALKERNENKLKRFDEVFK